MGRSGTNEVLQRHHAGVICALKVGIRIIDEHSREGSVEAKSCTTETLSLEEEDKEEVEDHQLPKTIFDKFFSYIMNTSNLKPTLKYNRKVFIIPYEKMNSIVKNQVQTISTTSTTHQSDSKVKELKKTLT